MSVAMWGATLQAATTFTVAAALAVYVARRPGHSTLRAPLVAMLVALMVWSAGVVWRFAGGEAGALTGFRIGWAGIAALPPLWLLLAGRYARVRALDERPALAALVCVPSALAYLALLTNEQHHLFLRAFSQTSLERGPLFYAFLPYGYACVLAGAALFLVTARRLWTREARRRSLWIAGAAILPTAVSAAWIFGALPFALDPTPAALGLAVAILTAAVLRLQLLDATPLAWRDVIDHLRDGVLIAEPGGHVLDASPAGLAILALPLEAIRGRRLAEVLAALGGDASFAERVAASFEQLAPDASHAPIEMVVRDERRIELSAKCLRGPEGGAAGRFVVLRDRTDERRYERLLHQSQKLETVGSLAAGVAHEVNNPLAYVRANLAHLERLAGVVAKRAGTLDEPEAEELAELPQIVAECIDGVERIGRIVDAMRRFSRVSSDELAPVDVNRMVTEAIRLAELHRNRGVVVEAWLDEGLPPVRGSALRLTQVFLNLLVNAKQALAGRPGGAISVRTRLRGDLVEVMVSDDGPGVPEGVRERIFDPFFTTKGPEEGTGLGLSIAFDIVREHGGVLELRPSPQGGACFLARLPVQDDADALGPRATP